MEQEYWGYGDHSADYSLLSPGFLMGMGPTGYVNPKKIVAKRITINLAASVQTRNRFSHLAGINEEEQDEGIPVNVLQLETAVEPYPDQRNRIHEAEAKGGVDQ